MSRRPSGSGVVYRPSIPADGGVPVLPLKIEAMRGAKSAKAVSVCPNCFFVLPVSGARDNCR